MGTTNSEVSAMGLDDKISNEAQKLGGKVKEGVGKVTDNKRLEAEGKADQVKADLKQAGEKVKDAFKR
jgi:uncharacterized protein YjbJ (UPF0337 family)